MHKVHFALQELQAIALVLHKMDFWLSWKVIALQLDNTTTKVYFCNQGDTAFLFSRLVFCI